MRLLPLRCQQLGEPKVGHLGSHMLVQKDVARLDVSVDDRWRASSVEILDPFRSILGNLKPLDPTNVLVAPCKSVK